MDISNDAKLPDILWKFHRTCGEGTPSNPHFYPKTLYEMEVIKCILPLGDRKANSADKEWTDRIYVHGDNKDGRFKLTSENQAITKLYGAVTEHLAPPEQPLILFKGL